MQDTLRLASHHSPWIRGELTDWAPLTQALTPCAYGKEQVVFRQQEPVDHVFVVAKGRVRMVVYHPQGAEKHLYFAEKGCLIGESAFLAGGIHDTTAETIVDSLLYRIPVARLQEQMALSPTLSQAVATIAARKVLSLSEQMFELAFAQSQSRVMISLVNLARQYGEETPQGMRIGIKFTHEELARLVNTSRVTVSNIFNRLSDQGILQRQDGYIYICRMDALLEGAEVELGIHK